MAFDDAQPGVAGPTQVSSPANIGMRARLSRLGNDLYSSGKNAANAVRGAVGNNASLGAFNDHVANSIGPALSASPLNAHNWFGRSSPAAPASTAEALPSWAHDQVAKGGGNPGDYVVHEGQLMKRLPDATPSAAPVASIAPVANVGVAPAPGAMAPRSAQGVSGPIGVGGAAPGMFPHDPVRSGMMRRHHEANSDADFYHGMGGGQSYDNALQRSMAIGQAISSYDDPSRKMGVLSGLFSTPQGRAYLEAQAGAPPGTIPAPGVQPANPEMARVTGDEGSDFLGKLRAMEGIPGASDPNSSAHQQFQDYVNRQYATPESWQRETEVPEPTNASGGFIGNSLSAFGNGIDTIFGGGRDRQIEKNDLLRRYGISSPMDMANARRMMP